MLKLMGETDIGLEKIESIYYCPSLQDTQDLEAATHTIVPTSRPAIASAQYSQSLTLPKPDNARLVVKRIAARLKVNITTLGTATHVYCSVRVDSDDTDHELFTKDWTSTGTKLDAVDTHSGNKSALFSLLADGAAHTFYFLFWADVASQAQIDVVQLWEGVGSCATGWTSNYLYELTHTGLASISAALRREGTGTPTVHIVQGNSTINACIYYLQSYSGTAIAPLTLLYGVNKIHMIGTVATDLNYLHEMCVVLRSEQ